ncbi:Dop1p Ecym_4246 [Eremothecium cymbalariae DBVPG|uniref:Uncharacterized protein n=1 Tax=Eremothecium cymbalariae (strain CBS 270.75 / DBVPG 7215 / KCTC 17166 / NRRL Y-17582) TaxID=931890 RepID=G8JTF8_ERECY|nr:hypothetical protein Ecym_4246 [Eremothecium cymbalariae DBVPG\
MSLPLKPLTIDSNSKKLDSKRQKFHQNVQKALQHFDAVTEWADYIASLGKLWKALQSWSPQFPNVKYYVPFPYQVSRRLASSLSPNLPSGVHLKTLDVYTFIFQKIGLETLGKECNIWIAGLLPLMSYASISVKSPLVELYEKYLIQLPPSILRLLIKPLIASLFPGVDEESSEFQPIIMNLLDSLRTNLGDDSLFWQSCFMVMIMHKNRRLGGLVWLTKRLPSLNAVPHLVLKKQESSRRIDDPTAIDKKQVRDDALSLLLPECKSIVSPEPGLLVRCLITCLEEDNELLIQRGILDLLLQRIHLHSPVLQTLVTPSDRQLLVITCCKTMLRKDMSLNRRIWNWLLGLASRPQHAEMSSNNDYFPNYGLISLMNGLSDMLMKEREIPNTFRVCHALMDRWEIGSRIVPTLFTNLMKAAEKYKHNKQIIKSCSVFFDSIETNVIWGNCYQAMLLHDDYELLEFILNTFNVSNDEEIIVKHCPLMLLALLNLSFNDSSSEVSRKYWLCRTLINIIPDRAYLPIAQADLAEACESDVNETLNKITSYYELVTSPLQQTTNDISPPFSGANLALLTTRRVNSLLIKGLKSGQMINEISILFVLLVEKIPEQPKEDDHDDHDDISVSKFNESYNWSNGGLLQSIFDLKDRMSDSANGDCIFGIVEIYSNYLASRLNLFDSLKLLKIIIASLWKYLLHPNTQMEAIRCLDSLNRAIDTKSIEGALTNAFIQEKDISLKLTALDALWNHLENDIDMIRYPLQLVFDELWDEQRLSYLYASKWVVSVVSANAGNRLFQVVTDNLLSFQFFARDSLKELDDLDLFTYHVQTVTNILRTQESVVLKAFGTELTSVQSFENWGDEDISTYKGLTVAVLLKFLNLESNVHGRSIRSVLILLDTLLDGTEQNFKSIVTRLLNLSTKYMKQSGTESEIIIVSLLNIVSRILSLSHKNGIKLDIFDDQNSHTNYIDFLVSSITFIESPLVISSYVQLLSQSIVYFQNSIFNVILPLSNSITQCIERLFYEPADKGANFRAFSLLIDGLEELLEISHGYLVTGENSGYLPSSGTKNDFLQSMVSNVFSNDTTNNKNKFQGHREVILQSFKRAVDCSFGVWVWAQQHSNPKGTITNMKDIGGQDFSESLHQLSYRYKFKTKKLIEKLFNLEPLEVLEILISNRRDYLTITLIHVLDGNRPVLTVPHLMQSLLNTCNKGSTLLFSTVNTTTKRANEPSMAVSKLDASEILGFITEYVHSLENAAMEEFYNDFLMFIKEISQNPFYYESVNFQVLILISIVSEKIAHCQFGQQKRVRKDLSDISVKYMNTVLSDDVISRKCVKDEIFDGLLYIVQRLHHIVNEQIHGDKFNSCVSVMVSFAIIPMIKNNLWEAGEVNSFLELTLAVAKLGAKVRNWKTLISEIFNDNVKLTQFVEAAPIWNEIIFEWSQYQELQDKLMNDLILTIAQKGNVITPTINPFQGWSDSEVTLKFKHMAKIAYLLTISPKDTYLLYFKPLMDQIEDYLFSADAPLKVSCYILLRAIFVHFDQSHLADHWLVITHGLQTGLQAFYESLQIQEPVDSNLILQLCKSLDLLLVLNFEEFSATNEWIFIIGTINCIYKTDPYMALIDEISECKDYMTSSVTDVELATRTNERIPLLTDIRTIGSHLELRTFFHNLSYTHYETMYGMKPINFKVLYEDLKKDVLAVMQVQ